MRRGLFDPGIACGEPRAHAALIELEVDDLAARELEAFADLVAPRERREDQQEAAAASSQQLAADGARALRDVVELVDRRARDARREALLKVPCAVEDLAELDEAVLQQRAFKIQGERFELGQAVHDVGNARDDVIGLLAQDARRHAGHPRVAEQQMAVELVERILADAQGVDEHALAREFDEVEPAERRRILILHPALDIEVGPFDRVREIGHLVIGQMAPFAPRQRRDERDDHRRGRTEAAARRGVRAHVTIERMRAEAVEDGLCEVDRAVERALAAELRDAVEIRAVNADALVIARAQADKGVLVDGTRQDAAAKTLGIRGYIGPAAAEADAEGRAAADDVERGRRNPGRQRNGSSIHAACPVRARAPLRLGRSVSAWKPRGARLPKGASETGAPCRY